MKTAIFYDTDFPVTELGMSWQEFLISVGIDPYVVIGGTLVPKDIDSVEIAISSAKATA